MVEEPSRLNKDNFTYILDNNEKFNIFFTNDFINRVKSFSLIIQIKVEYMKGEVEVYL